MLKRTIPLLIAVVVVLSAAPTALAGHCFRCRFAAPDWQYCEGGKQFGSMGCYDDETGCHETGGFCNHMSAAVTLSSEYQVASVERIDEAPAANEALVAQLDAPKPAAAESTR